jgi:hypothetical protein
MRKDAVLLKDFSGILFRRRLPAKVPAITAIDDRISSRRNWLTCVACVKK